LTVTAGGNTISKALYYHGTAEERDRDRERDRERVYSARIKGGRVNLVLMGAARSTFTYKIN
jgi:hypothetical protein